MPMSFVGGAAVCYEVADVNALPFPDCSFDGVRAERVLQHVADPGGAVSEPARVTRPGGRICLIDTDWESATADGLPTDLVARVMEHIRSDERMHHASMGRTLRRRPVRAGMDVVTCEPVTLHFVGSQDAAAIIPLFNAEVPPEAGMLPGALWEEWFSAVADADARGELLAAVAIWVVTGRKPS